MIQLSGMGYVFLATLAGLVLTLLTGWFSIRVALRLRLVDYPGVMPHKQHTKPIPYAGGIALLFSLAVLLFFSGLWKLAELRGIYIALFVIFVFGFWDDYKKLPPWLKSIGQFLVALILILSGIRIRVLEGGQFFFGGNQVFFYWLDILLTVLWVMGVTNAFNLVDSADGLSVGLAAWAFAFFMLATLDSRQAALSMLSALVLGICIGLHFYNSSPARLFLGDAGAQGLGLLVAAVAVLYTPLETYQKSSWFVPILLVGVPIFDTCLVFFSRLRRRKPFYIGGLNHTYHRLVALGLDNGRAVTVMHLAALCLECAAFVAVANPPLTANGIFLGCVLIGIACFFLLDNPKRGF